MKTTKRKSKTAAKIAAPIDAVKEPLEVAAVPVVKAVSASAPALTLASNCMVKDAAALKIDLAALANAGADVTVDVAAIERVDTATMQLLCAFVRDRAVRQQRVVWKGESQSWREAVRLLGVRELLGLAAEGSAA